jgi:hypothetical protein
MLENEPRDAEALHQKDMLAVRLGRVDEAARPMEIGQARPFYWRDPVCPGPSPIKPSAACRSLQCGLVWCEGVRPKA